MRRGNPEALVRARAAKAARAVARREAEAQEAVEAAEREAHRLAALDASVESLSDRYSDALRTALRGDSDPAWGRVHSLGNELRGALRTLRAAGIRRIA